MALGSDPTIRISGRNCARCRACAQEAGNFAALMPIYRRASATSANPQAGFAEGLHFPPEPDPCRRRRSTVAALTKRDLYLWRDTMATTPATANHAMAIMSGLLEFAVRQRLPARQPGHRAEAPRDMK